MDFGSSSVTILVDTFGEQLKKKRLKAIGDCKQPFHFQRSLFKARTTGGFNHFRQLAIIQYRRPEIIQGSMKLGRLWVSELKSILL